MAEETYLNFDIADTAFILREIGEMVDVDTVSEWTPEQRRTAAEFARRELIRQRAECEPLPRPAWLPVRE